MTQDHLGPSGVESAALAMLLTGSADGDVDAFAALYDRTCARLHGVALRVLRNPASAHEATRKAYLQAWCTADCFDPAAGSALAWLTSLTHRVAVDRRRAERSQATRKARCGNGNRVDGHNYNISEARDYMVRAHGDVLNDGQRETIALAYYEALTYQQVAEILGVPQTSVASRIRAGLTRLAQTIGTA